MTDERLSRRGFLRRASGLVVAAAAGGLALAPAPAGAAAHNPQCHAPYGPLHRYLWATSPDPLWADGVIWRESNWTPSAKNPGSTAAGLAQFIDTTWAWGQRRFGIYGSPYDPYCCIRMMNAFLIEGEYYHWALTGDQRQAGA